MKRYVYLLVSVILLGCFDKPITEDTETSYGSATIKIAGFSQDSIVRDKSKRLHKFMLTVTGDNMEPIKISQPVSDTGAVINIKMIPAGRARLFTGIFYNYDGTIYQGKASADIFGGKVANVKLVLRRTGSAQVEVVLEDIQSEQIVGNYNIGGRIDNNTIPLGRLCLKITKNSGNKFLGYFKEGDKAVGKIKGTATSTDDKKTDVEADFSIAASVITVRAKLKAVFIGNRHFKGIVYSPENIDSSIGILHGKKGINCIDTTETPVIKCITQGLRLDTCIDTTTLKNMAEEKCLASGRILSDYEFLYKCYNDKEADRERFRFISFNYDRKG